MDVELYLSNAKFAASTGNVEEARALLKQVLDYDPRNVRAWLQLADAVSTSKHAMLCLEKALKLEPDNEQARQKLAMYQLEDRPVNGGNGHDAWFDEELEADDSANGPEEAWTYEAYTAKKQAAEDAIRASLPPDEQRTKKRFGWEVALIAALSLTAVCMLGLLLVPGLSPFKTGSAAAQPETTAEDVTDVIIQNIIASNNEDFDAYMATIHSKSPGYEATAQMLSTIFGDFDLTYQISELELVDQTSKEAQVDFVLTTRKVRGPAFQDNRVSGRMFLKLDEGVWKIYEQKIENVEYLD